MIKHIAEGLVPFQDCGFARYPEMPLAGEPVTVCCRMDHTDAVPSLTLRVGTKERTITGIKTENNFYSFSLGAFKESVTFSYQFVTAQEQTPWYTCDVLTIQRITKPVAVLTANDHLEIALADDIALCINKDASIQLMQRPAQGTLYSKKVYEMLGGASIMLDSDCIWLLKRLSNPLVQLNAYVLYRDVNGKVRKVTQEMALSGKHIMGTGERFHAVDLQGLSSNGRVVEKFTHQQDQTYLPIPFFFTEKGLGWYRNSNIPAEMNFLDTATITQETEGETLTTDQIYFGSPTEVLQSYLQATGQPVLPPEWSFGIWISGNGWNCDAEVDAQLKALQQYDYPASVLVLEQWSDERTFYRWHEHNWSDPAQMVKRVRDAGLHLVLWQIPVIKHEWDGDSGKALEQDIREAVENGYVVRSESGEPYHITENWFHHSMLPDFTNPDACKWWFGKRKYLLDMGVEGFKTDGGEFLFEKTARLSNGMSGLAAHNAYPVQYIGAYHDFMRSNNVEGVMFSRAGYTGAQTQPIHWAGDQKSEWCELQAQLNAGLSAGLSGVLFWSFDIGGFAGEMPNAELYLRATAMGCFCPVMQWHAEPRGGQFGGEQVQNNDRSPWNLAEYDQDERILTISCQFAQLREQLKPYLWQEAQYCAQNGRPMMAHLCLDYPEDERAWTVHDAYMLGRNMLVAPVVQPGQNSRIVYLPKGVWQEYFTKEYYQGPCEVQIDCPWDRIPVFHKEMTP